MMMTPTAADASPCSCIPSFPPGHPRILLISFLDAAPPKYLRPAVSRLHLFAVMDREPTVYHFIQALLVSPLKKRFALSKSWLFPLSFSFCCLLSSDVGQNPNVLFLMLWAAPRFSEAHPHPCHAAAGAADWPQGSLPSASCADLQLACPGLFPLSSNKTVLELQNKETTGLGDHQDADSFYRLWALGSGKWSSSLSPSGRKSRAETPGRPENAKRQSPKPEKEPR